MVDVDSPDGERKDELSAAVDLYDEGRYEEAMTLLIPLAEAGNPESQRRLGRIYRKGLAGPRDLQKALYWYQRAAEQSDVVAQRLTGVMYREGEGTKRNYAKARMWFNAGAAQQDRKSISFLGHLYQRGFGVRQDHKKAYEHFLEAADMGDAYAAGMVGWYNDAGLIGKPDLGLAIKYFTLGTELGDPHSYLNLGRMYWAGRGVIANRRHARELIQQSADLGDQEAIAFIATHREQKDWD
jgi:TPR repeat protein